MVGGGGKAAGRISTKQHGAPPGASLALPRSLKQPRQYLASPLAFFASLLCIAPKARTPASRAALARCSAA